MKKMISIMLFLLSAFSFAEAEKSSPYVVIERLYPFDRGLIFYTSYADTQVSSCDSGKRFAVLLTHENYQVKASMLMAAFMAGKKISFRYDANHRRSCEVPISRFLVNK
ncbi:hypothetical protein [Marinagarivorans algicola]|uniref:hypothetical protein n=1 Tax=Marinagarivorans algicola TaxID=1513270 RepID=UPI0037352714